VQRRLAKLQLDMHVVRGDGNCQFRSVSFNLFGSQDYHLVVRKKASRGFQGQATLGKFAPSGSAFRV
jgi:hypothetical protein